MRRPNVSGDSDVLPQEQGAKVPEKAQYSGVPAHMLPEIELEVPGVATFKGSALARNRVLTEEERATIPEKRFFQVVQGGMYHDPVTRNRSALKAGKVIDNANYNIRSVQEQGIVLKKYERAKLDPSNFVE